MLAIQSEARHNQQSLSWPPPLFQHVPGKPVAFMVLGNGNVQALMSTTPFLCAAGGQNLAREDTMIHPVDLDRGGHCGCG